MADDRSNSDAARRRTTGWTRRRVLIAVAVLLVAWFVLFGRDARLDMSLEGPSGAVRPGETATVRDPRGQCIGSFPRVYEPYVLGMWRQTHPQRSPWWAPGKSGAAFSTLACSIGPEGSVTVPGDVTADRIAMCDTDNRCVEVQVDHSG